MAKTTLLEIVQGILSDADGDEVNDITDTVESDQCARVVRDEFDIIVNEFDLKMQLTFKQLAATGSSTPTQMTRPEGFHSIEEIKYDTRLLSGDDPRFVKVTYKDPTSFMTTADSLTGSDSNVSTQTLGDSGYALQIQTDRAPSSWTILEGYDDIIFNSYDSALETNLQASKTLVRGVQQPTLALTDSAVPDLPQNLMQLLKNRVRAFYFDVYKEGTTKEVDKRQRNSEVRSQRMKFITKKLQQQRTGPNYGRKS